MRPLHLALNLSCSARASALAFSSASSRLRRDGPPAGEIVPAKSSAYHPARRLEAAGVRDAFRAVGDDANAIGHATSRRRQTVNTWWGGTLPWSRHQVQYTSDESE